LLVLRFLKGKGEGFTIFMKLIIGNWKMNPLSLAEAKKLFNDIKRGIKAVKNEVIVCPPFSYLYCLLGRGFKLGAQNCFWEEKGPYTGEISPKMLKDLGVEYVIIGHSERRMHLDESDKIINRKLKAALKAGLKPILCIGEKRGENVEKIISYQLKNDLQGILKNDLNKIIIAYEPIWAIGTGNFCEAQKAKQTMDFIKSKIKTKVLYGGSVNSKIADCYTKNGFDGLLVGGASLNAKEFIKIAKNA